jgi:hypothetical protein
VRLKLSKPPANLEQAAEQLLHEVLEELVQGAGPPHLVAFSLGAARPMRWELEGAPSPPDELLRALADHEEAFVLALLHPAVVPAEVQAERAWVLSCEDARQRVDVMVALRGRTAAGGAEQWQVLVARHAEIASRWIGVPSEGIALTELDEVVSFGPEGEA